jgi:hypothetical protein
VCCAHVCVREQACVCSVGGAFVSHVVLLFCSNVPPAFPSERWSLDIPERLPPGSTLEFLPSAFDTDQDTQVLRYYVFRHPLFTIPNASQPLLSLAAGVSFDVRQRPLETVFEVLVEARDSGFPPLSAWLYLDIVVTAVTVVGPLAGRCFLETPCPLVWRGAGGGRLPWSTSFLASIRPQGNVSGRGAPAQTLALISRSSAHPLFFSTYGGGPTTGFVDSMGDVVLIWSAVSTQGLGMYWLDVVQDPLGPASFSSSSTSNRPWELAVPFTYFVREDSGCVFDGFQGCGTGKIFRTVVCVNQTTTGLVSGAPQPPLSALPVVDDRCVVEKRVWVRSQPMDAPVLFCAQGLFTRRWALFE